jgi:hypothetical protein
MLVPHGRKNSKFRKTRRTTDERENSLIFLGLEAMGRRELRVDLGFGVGSFGGQESEPSRGGDAFSGAAATLNAADLLESLPMFIGSRLAPAVRQGNRA